MDDPNSIERKKGRGRPRLDDTQDTKPVTIRLTETQKAKLERLGGSPWVRARIDKARDPEDGKT